LELEKPWRVTEKRFLPDSSVSIEQIAQERSAAFEFDSPFESVAYEQFVASSSQTQDLLP